MPIRLSTNTIYNTGIYRLNTLQSGLQRLGDQVATGRKILTAADDPIAAARVLEVSQSDSVNTQFQVNRQTAKASLSQVESVLSSATDLIQDVQTLAVGAGNATFSDSDRKALATEIRGKLDDMLGVANSSDGAGNFLFSGYKSTTVPFVRTSDGARYDGAQGQRLLQVASSREIGITDSGTSIFENNRTGNGTFTVRADAANTGSAMFTNGSVADSTALTHDGYEVQFTVAAGVTTYSVVNTSTGTSVSTGNAYQAGQPIAFDGMQFTVNGTPADTDKLTVSPSGTQSIFTTLQNLVDALETPVSGPAGNAKLQNSLAEADANLRSGLDNMLAVRSKMGSSLKELDYLDNAGADLGLQYATTLSDLQSLDYNKALSLLTQQQFTLEAAQKSFKAVSSLSLWTMI
jgi:flagellar hook-associated protein 3 FlgL